jgi:hypothetical protein
MTHAQARSFSFKNLTFLAGNNISILDKNEPFMTFLAGKRSKGITFLAGKRILCVKQ